MFWCILENTPKKRFFFSNFFLTILYTNASDCILIHHHPFSMFLEILQQSSQAELALFNTHVCDCYFGTGTTPGNNISNFLKNYKTRVTSKERKKSRGHHLFLRELGGKRWTLSIVVRWGLWGWVEFQLGQTMKRNYSINMTKVKVFLGIKRKTEIALSLGY